MSELLTSAQMRAIEQAATASGSVTGLELMERAGAGVVAAIVDVWPDLDAGSHHALVLCGPGNNGGDGFVIARLLRKRGWDVHVFLYGDPGRLPPDARMNYDRWCASGTVERLPLETYPDGPKGGAVVIDALFGTGLTRGLSADLSGVCMAFDRIAGPNGYRVAVDIPSGLCADSGRPLVTPEGQGGTVFPADLTVSFHRAKLGHLLADGPAFCGRLRVASIGLTAAHPEATTLLDDPEPFRTALAKETGTHKYGHGHALVLSGPSGRTGAARLVARAALRVGAGLVTLATPHDALAENAAHLTAIMLTEVDDADALTQVLADGRLNALALGPGLGVSRAGALVVAALATGRSTVLDADALTAFADDPKSLFDALHPACVLTPHAGEFARLFPDIAAKLADPATQGPAYSKVDATRDAAVRAGCTVLFKGPDTVIADETGRVAINASLYDRAAPWLATAGSGDVLAGLIAGLLARGEAPFEATKNAAWLHTQAALSFGPGLIAEDLPEELPKVFKSLGL